MAWAPSKEVVDNTDYDAHVTAYDHFSMARYFRAADWIIGGFGAFSSTLFGSSLLMQLLVSQNQGLTDLGKHIVSLSKVGPWLAGSFVAYAVAHYLDFRGLSAEHHKTGAAFNTIHRRAQRLHDYMSTEKVDLDAVRTEWFALNTARDEIEKANSLPTWGFVQNRSKLQVQQERQARKKYL